MIKSIAFLLIGILAVDAAVLTVSFMRQSRTLNEAGANISALHSQITVLDDELVKLYGSVSNLQSRLAVSEGNVSDLQARLKTSEMNATVLHEQMATKMAIVNNVPGLKTGVRPAAFTVDNLTIAPDTMKPGNTVTVVAAVTNDGGQAGTYRVILQIREYGLEIYEDKGQDVTLAPGESRDVTFSFPVFDPGEYVLSVGKLIGDLVVR